jgi:hypothetical protein
MGGPSNSLTLGFPFRFAPMKLVWEFSRQGDGKNCLSGNPGHAKFAKNQRENLKSTRDAAFVPYGPLFATAFTPFSSGRHSMMITGAGSATGIPYRSQEPMTKAGGDTSNSSYASGDAGSAKDAPAAPATTPMPLSASGLPLISIPPELRAQLLAPSALDGSVETAAQKAETAAQNNDRAFSLIRDAATGKVVGGVWPDAGIVSSGDIAPDDRLGQTEDWTKVSQYLANDIAQASGRAVTIQYFKSGDPSAPTFGSHPWVD